MGATEKSRAENPGLPKIPIQHVTADQEYLNEKTFFDFRKPKFARCTFNCMTYCPTNLALYRYTINYLVICLVSPMATDPERRVKAQILLRRCTHPVQLGGAIVRCKSYAKTERKAKVLSRIPHQKSVKDADFDFL